MIDVSEITSTKGKSVELDLELESTEISISGETFAITHDKPFHLCLENDNNKHLRISANTGVTATIPCCRCLEPTKEIMELDVFRELSIEEGGVLRSDDPDEEITFIEGHDFDPEQLLADEILISWPTKVLCKDDCKGLCTVCGSNLNHGECGCNRQVIDPRMAQFQDIFNSIKEV